MELYIGFLNVFNSVNTLIPLYDNEDGVCGILYNNVPYYFIKNLQGDVIAVTDKNSNTPRKLKTAFILIQLPVVLLRQMSLTVKLIGHITIQTAQ